MDEDICLIIYYTQLQKSIPHNKWKYLVLVCRRIVTVKLNIYIIYTHHLALHRHLLIWLAQDWDIRLQTVAAECAFKAPRDGRERGAQPSAVAGCLPIELQWAISQYPSPAPHQPVPPRPPPCSLQSSSLWWSSVQRLNTVPSTFSPSIFHTHYTGTVHKS